MSSSQRWALYAKRALGHVIASAILVASGFAIYFASAYSFEEMSKATSAAALAPGSGRSATMDDMQRLMVEYTPSITITALNIAVPTFFVMLGSFEHYSPDR